MPERTGAQFSHLMRAVLAQPWAIDPDSLAWGAICDLLVMRAAGERFTTDEIRAHLEAAAQSNGPRSGGGRSGAIAVIPLYGVISPRMNMVSAMSGGTTAEGFVGAFNAALDDGQVGSILLDIDSPGGYVQGITEAAAAVRAGRGTKPIVAIANHDAYSAAYWIASQADEIVVSPSGGVGSIGVLGAHQDISKAQELAGVKTTLVAAGKYKAEGNQFGPLSDEALAVMQAKADAIYSMFVADVAKGRGVTVDVVRSDYGQGRALLAKDGLKAGMVDRIDTFDATVKRMGSGRLSTRPTNVPAQPVDDEGARHAEALAAEAAEPDAGEQLPADAGESPDPAADEAAPPPAARVRTRHDLELLEAALRGGHGFIQ